MMESIRGTHSLHFPPMHDDDEEICGERGSKRPRLDDNEDEIGKFFAFVDRVRAMNEILKQKRATFNPAEAKNMEGRIMKGKSFWKPSFEWEDFSYGDMLFGGRHSANNSASAAEEIEKLDIGSGEGGKVCSSIKHRLVRNFDLNAEAPLENPVPPVL